MSAERAPADIACDIQRRLIDAGLFDLNASLLSAGHQRRSVEVKRRLEILAVSRAYGGEFAPKHWGHSSSHPRGTTLELGASGDDDEYRRETCISVENSYGGLKLEITTTNTQLAVRIAELVRANYA